MKLFCALLLCLSVQISVAAQNKPSPVRALVCKSGDDVRRLASVLERQAPAAISRRGLSWRQYNAIRNCLQRLEDGNDQITSQQAKKLANQLETAYTHYGWEETEKVLIKTFYFAREVTRYEDAVRQR
jgi:hypothetical protein